MIANKEKLWIGKIQGTNKEFFFVFDPAVQLCALDEVVLFDLSAGVLVKFPKVEIESVIEPVNIFHSSWFRSVKEYKRWQRTEEYRNYLIKYLPPDEMHEAISWLHTQPSENHRKNVDEEWLRMLGLFSTDYDRLSD